MSVFESPGIKAEFHGLGTAEWLAEDTVDTPLQPTLHGDDPQGTDLEQPFLSITRPQISQVHRAATQACLLGQDGAAAATNVVLEPRFRESVVPVDNSTGRFNFRIIEAGAEGSCEGPLVVLLHGFLGCSEDWKAVMGTDMVPTLLFRLCFWFPWSRAPWRLLLAWAGVLTSANASETTFYSFSVSFRAWCRSGAWRPLPLRGRGPPGAWPDQGGDARGAPIRLPEPRRADGVD